MVPLIAQYMEEFDNSPPLKLFEAGAVEETGERELAKVFAVVGDGRQALAKIGNGSLFGMADGSVTFFSQSINQIAYNAMGSRAGQESIASN